MLIFGNKVQALLLSTWMFFGIVKSPLTSLGSAQEKGTKCFEFPFGDEWSSFREVSESTYYYKKM